MSTINSKNMSVESTEYIVSSEKTKIDESYITFHTPHSEMLKITSDGFYVRGIKVPANEQEAESVYRAFKEFLIWSALIRN
jgi:hypothetical protein